MGHFTSWHLASPLCGGTHKLQLEARPSPALCVACIMSNCRRPHLSASHLLGTWCLGCLVCSRSPYCHPRVGCSVRVSVSWFGPVKCLFRVRFMLLMSLPLLPCLHLRTHGPPVAATVRGLVVLSPCGHLESFRWPPPVCRIFFTSCVQCFVLYTSSGLIVYHLRVTLCRLT